MPKQKQDSGVESYRAVLYDKYVSAFKKENASVPENEIAHYFEWCDARYYPHLKSLSRSAAILELGCGHGRILAYLQQKGFTNVKGIDISEEQIALARTRGLDAERADVFQYLDAVPSKFDFIIAIDFVEHFTREELLRLFESLHDAMNPNGIIVLQTVNGEGLFPHQIIHGDLTHETILSPGSMSQLLAATGFRDPQFFECAPVASGWTGRIRSVAWSTIRMAANAVRLIESGKTQPIWTENFICVAQT